MDLEGTDSIQRTKNRGNFERQTSLMALTLSEVLMVNMNTNDVGRAAGMNVETLRSVLEANLRLFSPNTKTLLLFVIRDQSSNESVPGVTPAKVLLTVLLFGFAHLSFTKGRGTYKKKKKELERQIREVVNKIWSDIEKPQNYSNALLTDMFDMDFFFVPHIIYETKLFYERIDELKSVPAEGLFTWTKQIWDAISTDESLNIPDQQKLLSAYRCEHALQESYEKFQELCQSIEAEVEKGEVKNFGDRLNDIIHQCLEMFDHTAQKYDPEVSNEKRINLIEKLETKIQYFFMKQQEHINHKVFTLFEEKLNNALPKHECASNFESIVNAVTQECHKLWSEKIDGTFLFFFITKTHKHTNIQTYKQLHQSIFTKGSLIKSDNKQLSDKEAFWKNASERILELTKGAQMEQYNFLQKEFAVSYSFYIRHKFFKALETNLATHMVRLFRAPSEKIWHDLSILRVEFHGSVADLSILKKLEHLMFERSAQEARKTQLKSLIDDFIIERCRKFANEFQKVLERSFDDSFKKDSNGLKGFLCFKTNGIPRDWAPGTNIQSIFTNARDKTLALLAIATTFELADNKDLKLPPIKETLIDAERIEEIKDGFQRYADNEFRNAEERMRRREIGGIWPTHPIQWLILLFFAWNEIWAMLKNPFLLIMFLLIAMIAFVAYQAHSLGFTRCKKSIKVLYRDQKAVLHKVTAPKREPTKVASMKMEIPLVLLQSSSPLVKQSKTNTKEIKID
ncbi:hypothetical protein RFI_10202 [Reticulomyxa filosa]|uniref:GB1/RHD3-type G domain-containing protein n=1 Tax=Reticulomyxa filosa TaxID=46433 RepID=X6NKX8_RETFI|nr:hypothetical protein RFI_10202 [Reticulomyxa filosa]|eukprot:ETO26930.1 hypothetical protein RFI_10202 [Reticulomyxa filosa]